MNKMLLISVCFIGLVMMPSAAWSKENSKSKGAEKSAERKQIYVDQSQQLKRAKVNKSKRWSDKVNKQERDGFLMMSEENKRKFKEFKDPFR